MFLERVPPVLVEAFLEKRLVLFVGAGISVGSGLPSGRKLAFELQNELFKNEHTKTRPSPDDPLQLDQVAQRYQLAFGRQKLNETLLKTFQRDGVQPNDAHKLAVSLFQRILTTNFDSLLEDAVKKGGRTPIVVVRDVQIPNTSIPDKNVIYKLHGDISTPERIVITQRDYQRVPITEGLRGELQSYVLRNSMLFVGYGLGDPDLLRVIELCRSILGQALPRSYAVIPGVENDPLFIKQCEEDSIDVFSSTAGDFLLDLKSQASKHRVTSPKAFVPLTAISSLELAREYRQSICEDFKWIDFKGIPVLDGHLRIPIDELFVSLSAVPKQDIEEEQTPQRRKSQWLLEETFIAAEGKGLFEILGSNPKLVILGDPGAGKTTFLRYIAYHLSLPQPEPQKIGLDTSYLPVFVPLREYATALRTRNLTIETFLPELFKTYNLSKYFDVVRRALEQNEAIILLDGLDEVGSEDERAKVATQVRRFANEYSSRLVMTSRKVGYSKAPIKNGFAHFVVSPFSDKEIEVFLDRWCLATKSEKQKANLIDALRNPRVRALAENPLLISILGRVYKAYRNLPERRAELYAKCVEALLTTWDMVRDLPPVFQDVREANRIMGPLALWIHRDCKGQFVTKENIVAKLKEIGNTPRGLEPQLFLSQIEERSGLLRQVGLDQYAFTHLTFQEYYVAREIVSRGNSFKELRKYLRNDRWQEVVSLTAGLLDDLGRLPVTEFLRCFLTLPGLPTKPTALQLAKFRHLIGCLKDKVEAEAYIEKYVLDALLSFVRGPEGGIHRLEGVSQSLAGLSKTRVGAEAAVQLRRIIEKEDGIAAANALVIAYQLYKEELERLEILVFALTHANTSLRILGSAAELAARFLDSVSEEQQKEVTNQVAKLPFERRMKILSSVNRQWLPPTSFERVVRFLTGPEERGMLPPELSPKRKSRTAHRKR